VAAYNSCCAAPGSDRPPLTVAAYKQLVNELNLWASSCALATVAGAPVGVVMATKRDAASLILAVGVLPAHRRQGHGRHLLTSLSNKLAILGPPRLQVELPAERSDLAAFFAACGYRPYGASSDFTLAAPPAVPPAAALAVPVGLDDILAGDAWAPGLPRAWERSRETLENRRDRLRGLAVASDSRIEAWLLHDTPEPDGPRRVVALGAAPGQQARALLAILLARCAGETPAGCVVPRVGREEVDFAWLQEQGFHRTRDYTHMAATPVAG